MYARYLFDCDLNSLAIFKKKKKQFTKYLLAPDVKNNAYAQKNTQKHACYSSNGLITVFNRRGTCGQNVHTACIL